MHLDVLDLRNFYYRTQLGRVAQRAIREKLVELWPETQGQTVVGFGFAVPLLRSYLADAKRVIGLMPGQQGVMPWPSGADNVSVLCEEVSWPVDTGQVDRLVVMHGLETSDHPSELLDECWRVLGPGGRAIFIVPNRAGLWSRGDKTPFGFGRPFTMGQLDALHARAKPGRPLCAAERGPLLAEDRADVGKGRHEDLHLACRRHPAARGFETGPCPAAPWAPRRCPATAESARGTAGTAARTRVTRPRK
jgi:SAM-dependent methyltransferase